MGLMPSWAMSGQAIDAVGDAHLAKGLHYRVLTNPLLGLPVVPLSILRVNLGTVAKGFTRRDITWVDSHGTLLTTPFTVTADNPVTGYLPLGQTCCWAAVEGTPTSVIGPGGVLPPILDPRGVLGSPAVGGPTVPGSAIPGVVEPPGIGDRISIGNRVRIDTDVVDRIRPRQAAFSVEGVVATALGDAPVAVRSKAPYHVYASHLERLVVRGSGTVTGVSWLPAGAVQAKAYRLAPLPIGPGARYAGPADGRDQGLKRVEEGAPQRLGMHEVVAAPNPAACDPATAADELDRVLNQIVTPEKVLDQLVNDTSATQQALAVVESVLDENGNSLGTSTRLLLLDLLQGVVDPGIARWLGFLDVDRDLPGRPGDVIAYVVDGLFTPDFGAIAKAGLPVPGGGSVFADPVTALSSLVVDSPGLREYVGEVKKLGPGRYLTGRVVLAATIDAPLDQPPAPTLDPPASGAWLPVGAPSARRELTLGMTRLVPGAGLSSAIGQPGGAPVVERNPRDVIGRRVLLTARPDPASISPTRGLLADREVDEQDGTWQVAQLDWFGRWSNRSGVPFAAAARPRPPRPTFTLTAAQPTITAPVPTGPLAGTVRIEVSVPPVASLPAGARLLASLVLTTTTSGAGSATTSTALPTPANPPETLVVSLPGPALNPTESGTVVVTAVWHDSAGVDSLPSDPKTATLHDPRPPAAVVIPPTLTYTARPDATGRARATLEWAPGAGQAAYRVFFADETTLRAKLAEVVAGELGEGDAGQAPSVSQAQAVLTALDAAADAPARGAVWAAQRQRLPRRWWRQLTLDPMPRPPSGSARFTHDVSGSLTVLALFRVVPVSAASVEADFATSPLVPRAVPNLLVPPVPSLAVLPVLVGSDLQARLTITVPLGPTPAARYRVRRATATSDPALMQVVAEGAAPPRPTGAPAPQVFTVLDDGSGPAGPRTSLAGWIGYAWRVEVQGAPAPGGGPPGEWSNPSAPAETTIMPPDPPLGVANLAVTRDAAGAHVRFTHPDPLAPGASTGYTLDVYRQLPGGTLRMLTSVAGQAPAPTGRGSNVAGTFDVLDADPDAVAGTVYRVTVTDPIGRTSPPSAPVVAP